LALGVAVLVIGGASAFVGLRGGSHGKVVNLQSDEKLYLAGVQVDPDQIDLRGKLATVVATATSGRVRRVGNVTSETVLDVGALLDAPSGASAQQAMLEVDSDPSGCPVTVGGLQAVSGTPLGQQIDAGKETFVKVSCPNHLEWSRWVLGIGGQKITLHAKPAK
jgi:hypothetical protein